MNTKMIGGVVAALGVIAAVVGAVLWAHLGFASKKFDAALGLGVVLLIVGVVLAVMPAPKNA